MTKTKQNANYVRGDDHQLDFTITDADGNPKTLTGATSLKWQAYDTRDIGGTAKISKTLADGVALFNVASTDDGVRVTLAAADTATLDTGSYRHELECVIGGKRVTLAQGYLTLDEELIANPTS